ncbi:MAG: KilA-N domain-containing protein [Bacilli bacterium]|nr:KilA-N domain-containing protein [Bacilli bacterium]
MKLNVDNQIINYIKIDDEDYISITDMLKAKEGNFLISSWLRNRNTIEFLGIWEELHNQNFNYIEFDIIKSKAGLNNFIISVKEWVEKTNAIGIISKAGRYGGTYAHKDIAFEFGMWISPKFKLLLIKEFERLKKQEQHQLEWNAKRELSKINYKIHTSSISHNLIPNKLNKNQINKIYADEADVLNMALFGMTAKEWRDNNKTLEGNMRDYASINELICLSNLESLNAVMINDGIKQPIRLERLNDIAISQIQILNKNDIDYLDNKQLELLKTNKSLTELSSPDKIK